MATKIEDSSAATKAAIREIVSGANYVLVPDATGVAATDSAAVDAAFVAAGTGGIVAFPPKQTYSTKGNIGSESVYPRKIDGNGSILKMRDSVDTTITTAIVTTGTTSATFTSVTGFAVDDWIVFADGEDYSSQTQITDISDSVVTFGAVVMAGTGGNGDIDIGGTVVVNDHCLYLDLKSTDQEIEITGLTFDGNMTNRTAGRRWNNQAGLSLTSDQAVISGFVWVHHCVFQNMPADGAQCADMSNFRFTENHLTNIFGSGMELGGHEIGSTGRGYAKNSVISNNSFLDVFKATDITTPTVLEFGHVVGAGCIATSIGPEKCTISNNVCDTSEAYGIDGTNNEIAKEYTLSGNVISNCAWGGFSTSSVGKRLVITGNLIQDCGTDATSTANSIQHTKILGEGNETFEAVVSGNIFSDSVFSIQNCGGITVTGNHFLGTGVTRGTHFLAMLLILGANATTKLARNITISGNTMRGAKNDTEHDLVEDGSSNQIEAIALESYIDNILVANNNITGFRRGVLLNAAGLAKNINITGNTLYNQHNGAGSSVAIHVNNAGSSSAISITNNIMSRDEGTEGNWFGVDWGTSAAMANVVIANNNISTGVSIGNTFGLYFRSQTGDNFMVNGNYIRLNDASDDAFNAGSFVNTAVATNNVIANGGTTDYGSALVTSQNNEHAG